MKYPVIAGDETNPKVMCIPILLNYTSWDVYDLAFLKSGTLKLLLAPNTLISSLVRLRRLVCTMSLPLASHHPSSHTPCSSYSVSSAHHHYCNAPAAWKLYSCPAFYYRNVQIFSRVVTSSVTSHYVLNEHS